MILSLGGAVLLGVQTHNLPLVTTYVCRGWAWCVWYTSTSGRAADRRRQLRSMLSKPSELTSLEFLPLHSLQRSRTLGD